MNKKKYVLLTLIAAAVSFGTAAPAFAQSTKSQAGGVPALADEVASLRAAVQDLQQQISNADANPYSGTYAVTLHETAIFGCGATNGPPPGPLQPYLNMQGISSVAFRSASFNVTADGTVMTIPYFQLLTHELRLSGNYETVTETEGGMQVVIAGNGSLNADLGDHGQLTGQISKDGSMFSALVRGSAVEGTCDDVFTLTLTGVKK